MTVVSAEAASSSRDCTVTWWLPIVAHYWLSATTYRARFASTAAILEVPGGAYRHDSRAEPGQAAGPA